jgi:serine phosphatase RsbU (regulator of sigma subunit)
MSLFTELRRRNVLRAATICGRMVATAGHQMSTSQAGHIPMSLIAELKRRNDFKVVVAYVW